MARTSQILVPDVPGGHIWAWTLAFCASPLSDKALSPEGPGIEQIWSQPSGLNSSSDRLWIEYFYRAHVEKKTGGPANRNTGIEIFGRDWECSIGTLVT